MIVVYEKGTNKFVGMAPQVLDNGTVREYKLEELYPNLDASKHGFFIVEDSPELLIPSHDWEFKLDKKGVPIGLVHKSLLRIALTTSAPDKDGDGNHEILAKELGGAARPWENAEIKVQLMEGEKVSKKVAHVKLSTTGGTLSSRILKTDKQGQATSTLTSSHETVTITVTATGADMEEGSLTFEVLPYTDFNALHGPLAKS